MTTYYIYIDSRIEFPYQGNGIVNFIFYSIFKEYRTVYDM